MFMRRAPRFLPRWQALVVILAAAACAASALPGPSAAAAVLPRQAGASSETGSLWLIFVDDLHLDFKATGRVKALFQTVSSELIREGDLFALVSTGPSSIAVDATRDRKRLEFAQAKISGASLRPSEIVAEPPNRVPSEVRHRAHVSFSTAYDVMKMLEQIPSQRKAFIYVSNGYDFDVWPARESSLIGPNPFLMKGDEFSVEDLREEVAELARQARRATVTIYGIDPRALSGPPSVDPGLDDVAWQKYWATSRNSLQVIAEETGGFALQDQTGFLEGLARIRDANRR
jgi:hypothetical protein